jgi:uncharacterized protein (DUF302 family)
VTPSEPAQFAYGSVVVTSLGVEEAIERVKAELGRLGWGVLFDLDVRQILHDKIGVEFRPYRILGACNPRLALEALGYEDQLGLLMPCNVVVSRDEEGTKVAAISAREQLRVTNNGMLATIADRADADLRGVLAAFPP